MATTLGGATLAAFLVNALVNWPAAAAWVHLLVVLAVTLRWGRVPGVLTAALAAKLVLTLLVEPRRSFAVADTRDMRRLVLSLAGMVAAVLLLRARDGWPWSGGQRAPRSGRPVAPATGAARPAVDGYRNGHAGLRSTREDRVSGRFLGEATWAQRPAGSTWLRTGPRLVGSVGEPPLVRDAAGRPSTDQGAERLAARSGLVLPAWVCASLLGTLAGVLLAEYGQRWEPTRWHPAAAGGACIVVASVALTVLAAVPYVRRGGGGAPPPGVDRLLAALSIVVVTLVGSGALAVIVVAGD